MTLSGQSQLNNSGYIQLTKKHKWPLNPHQYYDDFNTEV